MAKLYPHLPISTINIHNRCGASKGCLKKALKEASCKTHTVGTLGAERPVIKAVGSIIIRKIAIVRREDTVSAPGDAGIHITHILSELRVAAGVPYVAE